MYVGEKDVVNNANHYPTRQEAVNDNSEFFLVDSSGFDHILKKLMEIQPPPKYVDLPSTWALCNIRVRRLYMAPYANDDDSALLWEVGFEDTGSDNQVSSVVSTIAWNMGWFTNDENSNYALASMCLHMHNGNMTQRTLRLLLSELPIFDPVHISILCCIVVFLVVHCMLSRNFAIW